MSTTDLIGDLLLRWDELREQGRDMTPEELCRDHPELVEEVRRRIQALQAMYRIPNGSRPTETIQEAVSPLPSPSLPQVPDCQVLGLLGSGGMGEVYKARQLSLKRLVAVKMILTGVEPTAEEAGRFRVEAEAVARLQHPNIVQIFDIGEAQGCPYLMLEYVPGGNLADRLRSGPLPPDQAAELAATLARAIHFAHQHHIIHRDLKPSNILLAADGSPRISDFGLAKLVAGGPAGSTAGSFASLGPALTVSGSVLGTPSYMAPEQADGRTRQVGPLTDVYGLGAILYECLTGQPPFPGASLLETLERVRSEAPVAPRQRHPEVPVDLQTICLKCLEKEPEQRYASAEALADDLQRYLDREPIQARSPNLLDRLAWTLNRSRELPVIPLSLDLIQMLLPLPFLAQLLLFVLAYHSPWYGWIALVVTLASLVTVMLGYLILSGEGIRVPLNAATRHLWSVRLGLLLGMLALSVLSYQLRPPDQPWNPLTVFPLGAVLVGVTFFALGGVFWGRLYLFGVAFFLLAMLIPLRLEWGPLALGALISLLLGAAVRHVRTTQQGSKT